MAAPQVEAEAVERAERLLDELEEEARRLISVGVARAVEVAEDIWAEAQSLRSGSKQS